MTAEPARATHAAPARDPLVDLLRTASILVVLAVHLQASGLCRPGAGPLGALWLLVARNGSLGVTAFFVISGYLVTRMAIARDGSPFTLDVPRFYLYRVSRIWPLLAAVIVVGALALCLPAGPARDFCFRNPRATFDGWFWASLGTLLFNWERLWHVRLSPGFGLHWDVMWSLAIEEQFYLVFPWLGRLAASPRRFAALLVALVVMGLYGRLAFLALVSNQFLVIFTNSFAALDALALGVLVAWAGPRVQWAGRLRTCRWLCALGATLALGAYLGLPLSSPGCCVAAPAIVAWGVALLLWTGPSLYGTGPRWLARLGGAGRLSYGVYLLHPAVLYALWPWLHGWPVWPAYAVFAGCTFWVARASHRWIEAPAQRALRRLAPVSARQLAA